MITHIREMTPADIPLLEEFMAEVPPEDRTFFKADVTDPSILSELASEGRCIRRVTVDESDDAIVGFAELAPGYERTGHVADLRLVVAARGRRQGVGRALAQHMLVVGFKRGFTKVTVDIASDSRGPIEMFRSLGFQAEALLRDHLKDADGELHDLVVLAHLVDEQWGAMNAIGIDEAVT